MTNQEAIEILKGAIKKPNTKDGYLGQALTMGIEALENQKTGYWIKDGDSYSDLYDVKIRCHCSICGNEKVFFDRKTTIGTPCIKNCDNVDKYCSNCGAKMEGENNE